MFSVPRSRVAFALPSRRRRRDVSNVVVDGAPSILVADYRFGDLRQAVALLS